jgi:PPM family protein phosphatase
LAIKHSARSDQGKVRASNEDSFIADSQSQIFLVADGMGGHAAGEIASRIAASTVNKFLSKRNPQLNMEDALRLAVQEANTRVYETQEMELEYRGMGSTLTALAIQDNRYFLAHVGDSRAYLFRNKKLIQLSRDHSLVWSLYENRLISKEEIPLQPRKNLITRCIGTESAVEVDMQSGPVLEGDVFLLCTDGLTDVLSDGDIERIFSIGSDNLEQIGDTLIQTANSRGGPDNITTVVVCANLSIPD